MAKNRKTPAIKKKRFLLDLSPAEALGWGALLVFVCGWFFVLGIFVGRGTIPVPGEDKSVRQYLADAKNTPMAEIPIEPAKQDQEKKVARPAETPVVSSKPPAADQPPEVLSTTAEHPVKAPAVEKTIKTPAELPAVGKEEKVFTIQVAAMREADFADTFFQKLKKQKYQPYIVKAAGAEGGDWYRLRCGRFADREEAEPVIQRLRADGYSPILIQP